MASMLWTYTREHPSRKLGVICRLSLYLRCFPIVPKLACHHLGLPITNAPKPLTLLGGLTSFGGAGNNYSMHVGLCPSIRPSCRKCLHTPYRPLLR